MAEKADLERQAARSWAPMCSAVDEHRPIRMLVPVEPSEFGETALETAACTARLMSAEVHVVAVVPPEQEHGTPQPAATWYPSLESEPWGIPYPPTAAIESRSQAIEAIRQEAYDLLSEAAGRFEGLSITMHVLLSASIASAIVDYARESGTDLIVMPTHGRRPFTQALLGSIAAEVVHSGVAPCLLVKPTEG